MKKIIVFLALIFAFVIVSAFLWSYRIWPFATASNTPVFLGTTFGMSLPEVQRALKKSNIQLVDADTFEKLDSKPDEKEIFMDQWLASIGSKPLQFSDEHIENESWYMPSIEMFESQVVAEFNFQKNKLTGVEVRIFPLSKKNASRAAESIVTELNTRYPLMKREPSIEVPGAYRYTFDGDSTHLNFWVNLTDQSAPIITLNIYMFHSDQHKEKIQKRQTSAF